MAVWLLIFFCVFSVNALKKSIISGLILIRGRHDLERQHTSNERVMMIAMAMIKCIHKASASCYTPAHDVIIRAFFSSSPFFSLPTITLVLACCVADKRHRLKKKGR